MKNFRLLKWTFLVLAVLLGACQPELDEKYQPPEWLAGKVFSQLKEQPDASIFATAIERIGYDTILDRSGTYTIMAPTDDALEQWMSANGFNSIEEVPAERLEPLVKFHILQNPWTKLQLITLDVYGWIDSLDVTNDEPGGFKRQTILLEEHTAYKVYKDREDYVIDRLGEKGFSRVGRTDSRKFAPFFFKDFLATCDLAYQDYEFYFDRTWDSGEDIYFGNGKLLGDQVPAENGFIFLIDEVVEPMKNGYQFLADESGEYDYSEFLDLVNRLPEFEFNLEKTNNQPGADLGLEVDSLFDITFPELAFDLSNEKTKSPTRIAGLPENVTIRYHHGLMAPTNEALDKLVNDYIAVPRGWGSLEDTPLNLKRIIVNSHMSPHPVYPSDMSKGFYNGEEDIIYLDEGNIAHKAFGSNCTFVGLSEPIVPRAFSSVVGPVYLQPGFSTTMYAIEAAGLLQALKRRDKDYMFFFEDDSDLRQDSSLLYDVLNERFTLFTIEGEDRKEQVLRVKDLRNLLLNHVGEYRPTGIARKEFIPNLAGNYLIVNNETNEVSGTARTTIGFNGMEEQPNYLVEVNAPTDNGTSYLVENWFSFAASTLFNRIKLEHPHFYDLLDQAGLVEKSFYRFSFISESDFYTVLIPSDSAFQAFNVDDLSKQELQQLLKLHFIQGDLIFTDGRKMAGYYETVRIDEKSTQFNSRLTRVYLEPLPDMIRIMASDGSVFTAIDESPTANMFTGDLEETDNNEEVIIRNFLINGVIHQIDRVLDVENIDRD